MDDNLATIEPQLNDFFSFGNHYFQGPSCDINVACFFFLFFFYVGMYRYVMIMYNVYI